MMRVRVTILLLWISSWIVGNLTGQISLGQWRTHLPYRYCNLAEVTDDRVFCSTTGGLFTYSLVDNSIEKLSKIDGLSDVGVASMRWSDEKELLILAYQNSNIDIIRDGMITNMPDILNKQIPGDKTIYDIYITGEDAYLSTGFGIVVLNLDKNEIRETYYIGNNGEALRVNQLTVDDTHIWAATDNGIRRGERSDPFLVDFNSWELIDDFRDYEGIFSTIASFNGIIFASWQDPSGNQDRLYYLEESVWKEYAFFNGRQCRELLNQGAFLSLVEDKAVSLINKDLLVVQRIGIYDPRSVSLDEENKVWIADDGAGLITNSGGGDLWTIVPDGPQSNIVYDMNTAGGILYAVRGGVDGSWNNQYNVATMEFFENEAWKYVTDEESRDLVAVLPDPADPRHVFAASWGHGVHEFRNGEEVNQYQVGNSSLQTIIPGPYVRIGGLAFDPMGNLWVTNSNVQNPISVRKSDGTWKSFRAGNKITDFGALGSILVTRSGHKWVIIPRGNGLFAMDDNGTIDDDSDDIYERVSVVDRFGKVITNDVRSFAEDRNGNLWLGTNQGILVIYSPQRLFTEGEVYAQEIVVPREGEVNPDGTIPGDVLLGEQIVTCIEVDGANRKWLGTAGGGAYLVSEDGLQEIHHFTALNSPLLSDNIYDISVDGSSGEVYFATEKGIISYKGDALVGNTVFDQVVVYPNPVREDYHGPVAIKGLVEQTNVKIQDMGGNLVFETESLGGQAIWDGTNFAGERVATGVYLIFLTNADGTLSHVTKLLFIH